MENIQRAVYAEFLVTAVVGIDTGIRVGWRSCELVYQNKRLEVKASAYVQGSRTAKPSTITFGVRRRLEWPTTRPPFVTVPARSANLWIFSLFEPKHHPAGDILDAVLSQSIVGRVLMPTRQAPQQR